MRRHAGVPVTLAHAIVASITLLSSALVAGIFFAFSNFVMQALAQVDDSEGARAMQRINVTVLNPLFLGLFMGTAISGVAAVALGGWQLYATGFDLVALLNIIGGLLYVVGCFAVTGMGNVPLNDRLEAVDANSEEGIALWQVYLRDWTRLNHARTLASFLASAAFVAALILS